MTKVECLEQRVRPSGFGYLVIIVIPRRDLAAFSTTPLSPDLRSSEQSASKISGSLRLCGLLNHGS